MPNDTTQQTPPQAPPITMGSHNMAPQSPQMTHPQQPQGGDTEKMLLQFLKEMEQNMADLNERVDLLENKEHGEPQI